MPGLVHETRIQERAATAGGSSRQGREVNPVSCRFEDPERRVGVLGLEVGVEGIDPEKDLRPVTILNRSQV